MTPTSVTDTTDDRPNGFPPSEESPGPRWWRIPMAIALVGFAAFWVWALMFAEKEAVNRIGDRAWAERAEAICLDAEAQRWTIANLERFDPRDPDNREQLLTMADNLDQATDDLEVMLNDVVAVAPTDDKGAEIVPLWEADYRTYIEDRREYTDGLRAGEIAGFTETALEGLPISEKLTTFADENEMPSCAPPTDMPQAF